MTVVRTQSTNTDHVHPLTSLRSYARAYSPHTHTHTHTHTTTHTQRHTHNHTHTQPHTHRQRTEPSKCFSSVKLSGPLTRTHARTHTYTHTNTLSLSLPPSAEQPIFSLSVEYLPLSSPLNTTNPRNLTSRGLTDIRYTKTHETRQKTSNT